MIITRWGISAFTNPHGGYVEVKIVDLAKGQTLFANPPSGIMPGKKKKKISEGGSKKRAKE